MKKKNKIQPAVMTFSMNTRTEATFASPSRNYIDLSQIASIVNRRFYRQGINWAVAGFKVASVGNSFSNANTSVPGTVRVCKLPNTWVTSNAWEKAFRAWNKQQKDDLDEAGGQSAMAKFRDFKVFMEPNHVTDYSAGGGDLNVSNLMPFAAGVPGTVNPVATGGEWEPSQIVVPNTQADASGSLVLPREYFLHMVGVNNNGGFSRGVLEGYADSRAYPQSPDPVAPDLGNSDNWMRDMFNVGDDNSEVIRNATERNDELPYPQVDYPGGENQLAELQLHDFTTIFESNVSNGFRVQNLKGGNFPCGLIAVDFFPADLANPELEASVLSIQIDLVPGNHRGYLCEPMTEM